MARTQSRGTLVDHLVAAIVPALIMVMVGGLMFFLLDLWYEGPFLARLRWILFWFVFGIVLITRVGMQVGGEQAKGYGLALGGAVALVATSLAGFQPFLLAVMGLVWWATHKLTYDCTLIDEDQDAGVGLLEESGLDPSAAARGDRARRPGGDGRLAPAPSPLVEGLGTRPRRGPPSPSAGRLAHLFLARLAPGLRPRPVARAGRRGGSPRRARPLFPGLPRQRDGPAAGDELPQPAPLPQEAQDPDARGDDGDLADDRRRHDRRTDRRRRRSCSRRSRASGRLSGSTLAPSDRRASRWAMLKDGGVQGDGAASEGDAASKSARGLSKSRASPKARARPTTPTPPGRPTARDARAESAARDARSRAPASGKSSSSKGGTAGKQGPRQDRSNGQGKGQDQAGQERRPSRIPGRATTRTPNGTATRPAAGSDPNNPVQPPSLSFQAPSWLRIPILIAGIIFLIFGAIRYGPDLLKGLWAMIGALLGGLWFGGPRKPKPKEDAEASSARGAPASAVRLVRQPLRRGPRPPAHARRPGRLQLRGARSLGVRARPGPLAARDAHRVRPAAGRRPGPALGTDAVRLASYFVTITYGRRGFKAEILPPLRQFWRAIEGSELSVLTENGTHA